MKMLHQFVIASFCIACVSIIGCDGSASVTDDSTQMEVEAPKVEVGDEPLDMNPATDDDLDIDTPLEGDS